MYCLQLLGRKVVYEKCTLVVLPSAPTLCCFCICHGACLHGPLLITSFLRIVQILYRKPCDAPYRTQATGHRPHVTVSRVLNNSLLVLSQADNLAELGSWGGHCSYVGPWLRTWNENGQRINAALGKSYYVWLPLPEASSGHVDWALNQFSYWKVDFTY